MLEKPRRNPMIRTMLAAATTLTLLAGTATVAAPCKDAKGKFTKCPPTAPATNRCVDSKTKKFAKCGAPGAVPMPVKK
jgi:hypothetical protein